MMADAPDTIAEGRDAWAQIHHATTFGKWKAVAAAVAIGRQHALRAANTNTPYGAKYAAVMNEWLDEQGFRGMPFGVRTACCALVDNMRAIEAWRATLPDGERQSQNHPETIIRNWRRTTRAASEPKRWREPKAHSSGHGRAVHWPADALRRAATAIREARSNDCIVLARRALEAAVRSEQDIVDLLPPDPLAAASRHSAPAEQAALA